MELKKEKKVNIAITIPEWINDYITKAVESYNKIHEDKISKSHFISVILEVSIMEHHLEQEKNDKSDGKVNKA